MTRVPEPMPAAPPVHFRERLDGFVCAGEREPETGFRKGRPSGQSLSLRLDMTIADVDAFLADPEHWLSASGTVVAPLLGGSRPALGRVSLLAADPDDAGARVMRYVLETTTTAGAPVQLVGTKWVREDPGFDPWADTTTLFLAVTGAVAAAGKLHIGFAGVAGLTASMLAHAGNPRRPGWRRRLAGTARFLAFFLGTLWTVYGAPKLAAWRRPRHFRPPVRPYPLHTLQGVGDAHVETHHVTTADGLTLSLLRFCRRGATSGRPDSVLLLHGLTSSSDMFIMPEHVNLVRYLHEHGYGDVWCFDSRMSGRGTHNLRRHRDSMDDVALFDHPAAVARIRAVIGARRRLHVIAHCLGATTFMMSLFGGRVTGITSVVCNSVALTPRVSRWSRVKLAFAPFLVEYVLSVPYVSPRWRDDPGLTRAELFARAVTWWHRECDEPACHMVSMMWGSGAPAVYRHANLHPLTHRRLGDLFGGTSMHYYRHVRAMVRHGVACRLRDEPPYRVLPEDYLEHARTIPTPVLFLSGDQNNIFADSNPACFEHLYLLDPAAAARRYELRMVRGYGHQDVFMGRDADRDVFPHLVDFIERHRG